MSAGRVTSGAVMVVSPQFVSITRLRVPASLFRRDLPDSSKSSTRPTRRSYDWAQGPATQQSVYSPNEYWTTARSWPLGYQYRQRPVLWYSIQGSVASSKKVSAVKKFPAVRIAPSAAFAPLRVVVHHHLASARNRCAGHQEQEGEGDSAGHKASVIKASSPPYSCFASSYDTFSGRLNRFTVPPQSANMPREYGTLSLTCQASPLRRMLAEA